jgi:hypothetical protein
MFRFGLMFCFVVLTLAGISGLGGEAISAVQKAPSGATPAAAPDAPASAPSTGMRTPGSGGATAKPALTKPDAPLPPVRAVDALLEDIVKALGGADNLNRHKTMYTRVEITLRGLGMTGSAEHFATVGDKALTLTAISGLASTREGCDGRRCWSEDPINGLRMLSGAEAEQALLETAWNPELRFKELFTKLEVRNERDGDGSLLECLVLTPRQSAAWTNCFDARTHLLTVQRVIHAGPQGEVPFTSRFADWRKVEDLEVPYSTEMQAGPLAFSGKLTAIELDLAIDAKRFAVPTEPGESSSSTRAPAGGGRAKEKEKEKAKTKTAAPSSKPRG